MAQGPKESLNRPFSSIGRREFLQTLAWSALALSAPRVASGAVDKRPTCPCATAKSAVSRAASESPS
jgi:hypothetical protein